MLLGQLITMFSSKPDLCWSSLGKTALPGCFVFLLAVLLYAGTLGHGFVFDDVAVLSKNIFVQKGIIGLPEIFTTGSWQGFAPERNLHIYRPLQLAVLALQHELFGQNPLGYHIIRVLSYGALCWIVWIFLRKLLLDTPNGEILAFLATVIFTLHPVHTEVAANIKGNGDLLAMLFGLVSLLFYCDHIRGYRPVRSLLISSLALFLALFTKETAVSFVGIALLMVFFYGKLDWKKSVLSLIPLLFVTVVYLAARMMVFGSGANSLNDTTSDLSNIILLADSTSQRLGLKWYALGSYLRLSFLPYPLLMAYVYDGVNMVEFHHMESLFPLFLYALMAVVFVRGFLQRSTLAFAIGFYFVTIILFSHFIFSVPSLISERWLLVPSLGASLMMAMLFIWLFKTNKAVAILASCILILGYGGYTIQRAADWRSNLSLTERDVRTSPRNYLVLRILATELHAKAAREDFDPDVLRRSARYIDEVLQLAPADHKMRNLLGLIYERLGLHDEAASAFWKVSLGNSNLKEKARYSMLKNMNAAGSYFRALPLLEKLEKDYPQHTGVLNMKGEALSGLGRREEAYAVYRQIFSLEPANSDANKFLADYYLDRAKMSDMDTNDLQRSIRHHIVWLDKAPLEAPGHNRLGQIYEHLKNYPQAAESYGKAARIEGPLKGKAAFSRAKNYAAARMHAQALEAWLSVARDYPSHPGVLMGMGDARYALGDSVGAAENYRAVVEEISSMDATGQQRHANTRSVALQKLGLIAP